MESTPKSHFKSRSQSQIPQSCAVEGLDNFIKNNDAYVIWWAWARRWGLLRSAVSTNPTTYERVLMFFDQIRKLSVHAGLSPQICINLLSFSMLPFWLASSQRTWTCICWLSGLLDVVARAGQPSDLLEKVPLNAFINLTLETNCRLQICWLEWGGILYKSLLEKMSLQENLRQPLTYREAQRDELEWSVCVCVCVCVCVLGLEGQPDEGYFFRERNTFASIKGMTKVIQLCFWKTNEAYAPTVVFQSSIPVQLFATPWTAAHQTSLSFTISLSLPKIMSIESVMPSSHHILCCPLFLLPPNFPCIRVFSNELALHIR